LIHAKVCVTQFVASSIGQVLHGLAPAPGILKSIIYFSLEYVSPVSNPGQETITRKRIKKRVKHLVKAVDGRDQYRAVHTN